MLRIQHEVPGRVRFRVQVPSAGPLATVAAGAQSTGRPANGAAEAWMQGLATALRREPGVRAVRLNAACASLVVHYDPRVASPERLRAAVSASTSLTGGAAGVWTRVLGRLRAQLRMAGPAGGSAPGTGRRRPAAATCRACRLQRRLLRWLLRSTLRCWWAELRTGRRRPAPKARPSRRPRRGEIALSGRQPLLTRLRRQAAGASNGYALIPVSGPVSGR